MHPFSPPKFRSLPVARQHRHLARILRSIYETRLDNIVSSDAFEEYSRLREWMGLTPLHTVDTKSIADEYHQHLKHTEERHREHNLLPQIEIGDRDLPLLPPLSVTVYLDNLRSAHNVGSIIRTIEAFGLGSLAYSAATPGPDHKQVQDTAMGAEKWIESKQIATIETLPRPLIALETASTAEPIHSFSFPETFTLAVGNEEYGCSDEILNSADAFVRVPMAGRKNSLNVANALAVTAAEIRRQYYLREEC